MPLFKQEKINTEETPVLLYPPLIETIFELRWEIETDRDSPRMRDPSYPMMYGSLYERLKKDLPLIEDLPSTQAHPEATSFIPRHRMRKAKESYPLVQIGPGIITVNESKSYSWKGFSSLVLRVIGCIEELFPSEILPLNFMKAELRYVNAVRFDLARENPLSFLHDKLHIRIEMDDGLFEKNRLNHRPNAVGLNIAYALEKPLGNLAISANLGQFEGKPALIQQTLVQSFGDLTPADHAGFALWLEDAHITAENVFQVFSRGELMQRYFGG